MLSKRERELLTSTANLGSGSLDSLELTLGASLVGAVAETVAEVRVLAETGVVVVRAAKVLCLVEHAVDTSALGPISIVRSISYREGVHNLHHILGPGSSPGRTRRRP